MPTHSNILAWRIPMDRAAWWATVLMAEKSWTQPKSLNMCARHRASHHFVDKGLYSQSYVFSSSHVWMWELGNFCIQIVVLEKTLESPLDCREMKPDNPKRNPPWESIGRTDTEAEAPILWPPDSKSWLIGKAPDAGKDWGQEQKGATEDETAGWHHRLKGHEF